MAQDIKLRLAGIAFILGGAVLGWFFALGPLREAQAGVAEISYSTKIFILVPFCLVFGLAFLLFGEQFQYRNADHKTSPWPAGWPSSSLRRWRQAVGGGSSSSLPPSATSERFTSPSPSLRFTPPL
jgi:hypothetical protein